VINLIPPEKLSEIQKRALECEFDIAITGKSTRIDITSLHFSVSIDTGWNPCKSLIYADDRDEEKYSIAEYVVRLNEENMILELAKMLQDAITNDQN